MNILQSLNPYRLRERLMDPDNANATLLRVGLRTSIAAIACFGGNYLAGPFGSSLGAVVGVGAQRLIMGRPVDPSEVAIESLFTGILGGSLIGSLAGQAIGLGDSVLGNLIFGVSSAAGAYLGTMQALASMRQNAERGPLSAADAHIERMHDALAIDQSPFSEEEILKSPQAFVMRPDKVYVHPLVLQRNPEAVLSQVASRGADQRFQVNFLNDRLQRGVGVDASGLYKQFMSELFKNVLGGSEGRTIQMLNGIPTLSPKQTREEKQQLFNLGIMLRNCCENEDLVTGRVLPDHYFTFLSHPLIPQTDLTDDEIIEISFCLMDSDQKRLLAICRNPDALSRADFNKLQTLGIFNLPDHYRSVDDQDIKDQILKFLAEESRSKVLAAQEVRRGMGPFFEQFGTEPLPRFAIDRISTYIQGNAFSRTEIANRILYRGSSSVLQQKTAWLKAFIRDERTPQEWVEQFLFTVTGQRNLTAATSIHITPSMDDMCRAHTCFNQLDVPLDHTDAGTSEAELDTTSDRQLFLNNLQVLIDFAGADYQIS